MKKLIDIREANNKRIFKTICSHYGILISYTDDTFSYIKPSFEIYSNYIAGIIDLDNSSFDPLNFAYFLDELIEADIITKEELDNRLKKN